MPLEYGKPPIIEAIFDLRVEPRPGASAVEIADAFKSFAGVFPNREELPANPDWQITVHPGFAPRFAPSAILGGFRYNSADGRRVIIARRDAFTFSFIGTPQERYQGWELFAADARRFWEAYRTVWRPRLVTRAALRFINQFDFERQEAPDAYFLISPGPPRSDVLPVAPLTEYQLQLTLPQTDIEATAIINHVLAPTPTDAAMSFVLDVDLFQQNLSWNPDDDATLWNAMEVLRTRKNDLFRACITDATETLLVRKDVAQQ